ncbi:glycosyl hydrolase family 17 protein [Piscinibacterium candidicorallinum]|uniref:Endo-1,3-beta-glucanase btgC n=1 Tax=Piscinibacterium candidicorallinum TaxID=1793872 RepID=A0ABV7H3V0_9BURK
MNSNWLPALTRAMPRTLAVSLGVSLLALASGCGGGGSGGYTPLAVSQSAERRELPEALITRAAINYSPYRTSRSPADLAGEIITPANVLQDLRLIQATGIGTIRLFSSRAFAETVLQVIRDNNLDLKVQLGAFLNAARTAAAEAENQAELDTCIRLANSYRDIVLTVSVGNEKLVEWSPTRMEPAVVAAYLRKVRSAVRQPVTTNDNWLMWSRVPREVAETVDFAAVHVYPFLDTFYDPSKYDWRQKTVPEPQRAQAMIDATIVEAKKQFNDARAGLAKLGLSSIPMVIGETGWAAVDTNGGPNLAFRAHPVNQKMYFDALQVWAQQGRRDAQGPKAIFFFQAFDEPWKQGDDGWGLFNAQRQARYTIQSLGTCGVTWTCEPGTYTAADAVKWVPPTLQSPVTSNRYTLYADTPTPGEDRATGLRWDPFVATGYRDSSAGPASADGGVHLEISPNPADFGWGLFHYSDRGVLANLSNFSGGRLNFQVRSDGYPGKIEIGISTDSEDRDIHEAFLQVAPGQYGYCNSNNWCSVSIPVSAFLAANPKLDLRYVNFRFIVADRFSFTDKPLNLTGLPVVRIDNLHWSR